MTTQIETAIARSISHDERVSVDFAGTEVDLLWELHQHADEIGSVKENDGTIDAWGWSEDTPETDMDWRLCVTLTDAD